ncbi:protoporphyrinogen oxidase [Schlesneria sp.]|uniref:protoporphyrinogen oxidase n=1 Tax=Schlesneria sp. TaxID=2762018 RepID=UPI002F034824
MQAHDKPRRIAVIGGGLAGLSAAHRLCELAGESRDEISVTLFEAGSRLGGLVGTERIGDYLVDLGADSFLTNKPAAVSLCRRLGMEDRLVSTDTRFRGALVLFDGRPVPIPEGFQLLSPTAIWPVVTSPLFSVWGKVRLLSEWFLPRRQGGMSTQAGSQQGGEPRGIEDESLSSFVLRRFGREALERLIQPLVGGIYTADPTRLSLAATMPRFLEMERDYGSLIRASLFQKSKARARSGKRSPASDRPSAAATDTSSGARYGLFAGLKGGMEDLVDALGAKVRSRCDVRLQSEIRSITECSAGVDHADVPDAARYRITLADGSAETFSGLVIAASASRTSQLVSSLDAELSEALSGIEYASSAIVVSGHRLSDIRDPLHAFGLVIPHREGRRVLAVSFSSRKFPERAPAGHVLLRTFVGGALQPEILENSDERIIEIVREELAEMLGVHGQPDFMRVVRYRQAMPQYHVGHLEQVTRIEKWEHRHTGLALAGITCHGVGVPDAIASGEQAAERVWSTR